jgi:acetoin utilization protein AcuB
MRLSEIMSSPVETIEAGESAEAASRRMQSKGIHHLIVTRDGLPVGVLSARDLSGPRGVALRWAGTAEELMSPKVVFATPATTVREAANLLRGRNIGCLPILEGRKVIGIVTITDLIELVGRGLERPAVRSTRRAPMRPASRRGAPPRTTPSSRLG